MNENQPTGAAEIPTLKVEDAPVVEAVKTDSTGASSIKVPVMVGGVLVVVAIAAGSLVFISQNTAAPENGSVIEQPGDVIDLVSFKDGTYYAEVEFYVEPVGKNETLGVTLVIENGEIKSATAVNIEDGEEVASSYMDEFNDGIVDKVVAADFAEIYSTELVSGSTLTSDAFKEALKLIEEDASRQATLGDFADGEYSSRIKYYVAAKKDYDDMIVTVTIADNQITEVHTSKVKNGEPTVDSHTEEFDMEVMEIITGQDVDYAYTTDLVSGSTLTNNAFQKALETLKPVVESTSTN